MGSMMFDKRPGQLAINEDEGAFVIGTPDFVTLPPELGGGRANVIDEGVADCPKCGRAGCKHLVLDVDASVAECVGGCGFVWYRKA
jgi:hypothetical protein